MRNHEIGPEMKKSKFSEAQIIYAIRENESGVKVSEIARRLGISQATFFAWKKKFGDMGVAELGRLRALEDENARLKKLVADLSLYKQMLQDIQKKKKALALAKRKAMAHYLQGCIPSAKPTAHSHLFECLVLSKEESWR